MSRNELIRENEWLREALKSVAGFPAVGRAPDAMKEIARAALERTP